MTKILFSILLSFNLFLMGDNAWAAARPVAAPRPYHSLYRNLYENRSNPELTDVVIKGDFSKESLRELDTLSRLLKEKMPNQKIDWKKELKNLNFSDNNRIFLIQFMQRLIEQLPPTQQTFPYPSFITVKRLKDVDVASVEGRSIVKTINEIGDAYIELLLKNAPRKETDLLVSFLSWNSALSSWIEEDKGLDNTLLNLRWVQREGGLYDNVEGRLAFVETLNKHGPKKMDTLLGNVKILLDKCQFSERGLFFSPMELTDLFLSGDRLTLSYGHVEMAGLGLGRMKLDDETLARVFAEAAVIINQDVLDTQRACEKQYGTDSESIKGCMFKFITSSLGKVLHKYRV